MRMKWAPPRAANLSTSISRQSHYSNLPSHNPFIDGLQNSRDLKSTISTHCSIVKSGFSDDTFTNNHLLNSYTKFRRIDNARKLFDEMSYPNVVSWTAIMAGYIDVGRPEEALCLFNRMLRSQVRPNAFTIATAVNACSALSDLRRGREMHAVVETSGFQSNLVICTSMIDMYGKSNDVDNARRVFNGMVYKNVISWTSMISAYAQNAHGHEALELFGELLQESPEVTSPNHFTYASILNACASLGRLALGKATHVAVIRLSHDANDVVASALIDMYSKCGCIAYCEKLFRRIKEPSVIPYTSMIVGAAKHGMGKLSLDLFQEMLSRGVQPNDITFVGRLDEAYQLIVNHLPDKASDAALMWAALLSAARNHKRVDLAVEAGKKLIEMNENVATAYVVMSNAYASAGQWEEVRDLRSTMKRHGVHKEPGCSWVEVKNATYKFYAGEISMCANANEVAEHLRELEERMKERGYVGGRNGSVLVDLDDDEDRELMQCGN
ncbi:hypothetical protein ACLOJK_017952 [Asimina triloba]